MLFAIGVLVAVVFLVLEGCVLCQLSKLVTSVQSLRKEMAQDDTILMENLAAILAQVTTKPKPGPAAGFTIVFGQPT